MAALGIMVSIEKHVYPVLKTATSFRAFFRDSNCVHRLMSHVLAIEDEMSVATRSSFIIGYSNAGMVTQALKLMIVEESIDHFSIF